MSWKQSWKRKLSSLLLAAWPITISATIGEPRLTLFGWSSPLSLIQLEGQRVAEQVISQENGFFLFDRVLLPPANPELCLSVVDRGSRVSAFPTCLPALPAGNYELNVGPVLLPPTLIIGSGAFEAKGQVSAKGSTIPNTKVKVFLNNDYRQARFQTPSALAYGLPSYEIRADKRGNYELNLPYQPAQQLQQTQWRIFASAEYQESPTPKSNTLTFTVFGRLDYLWWQIKNALLGLLRGFKPDLWLIMILEILLIAALIWRRRKAKEKSA